MPTTHLVSVGTSVISNCARSMGIDFKDVTDNHLNDFLAEASAEEASAETNSLHRALEADDTIVFFYSETTDCERAATVLQRHLQNSYDIKRICVEGLTLESEATLRAGLRNYVRLLIEHIDTEKANGRSVKINATGGFKPQVSLATLIGSVYRVPVYYIFSNPGNRSLQTLLSFAPLPVRWDPLFLTTYEDVFNWLLDPRDWKEVERRVRPLGAVRTGFDETFWGFVEKTDTGDAVLSAAGLLFTMAANEMEVAPATLAEALERADEELDVLDVWESARRAAEASEFKRPEDILKALRAVAVLAKAEFSGSGMSNWKEFFARHGIKYAQGESESTMNRHGEKRNFTHEGETRTIERHLTFGKGDQRHCAQVYFDLDRKRKKAAIAYCGGHLPTATDTYNN